MLPKCEKCKGAGIAGLSLAFILHCPVDLKEYRCPYLPDNQNTHQEIYIPPQFDQSSVTVASSATTINHPNVVYETPDPGKSGSTLYYIDITQRSA